MLMGAQSRENGLDGGAYTTASPQKSIVQPCNLTGKQDSLSPVEPVRTGSAALRAAMGGFASADTPVRTPDSSQKLKVVQGPPVRGSGAQENGLPEWSA